METLAFLLTSPRYSGILLTWLCKQCSLILVLLPSSATSLQAEEKLLHHLSIVVSFLNLKEVMNHMSKVILSSGFDGGQCNHEVVVLEQRFALEAHQIPLFFFLFINPEKVEHM